ncbi:MAG: RadC family protein [Rhodospirillaceae bacterium]
MSSASSSTGGHRTRLRKRFLAAPDSLPDYELLELLLFQAHPRGDVKPLAKELIARFGSYGDAIAASPERLRQIPGVGEAAIAALKTAEVSAVRLLKSKIMDKPILGAWDSVLDYCHADMDRRDTEQFRLLFLDNRNRLIADELQQKGTVNHTPVYPREVVKRALELQASALIMVHNHPSGDPTPSKADKDMTHRIRDALSPVGILLHDHLVVGRNGHVSFRSQGLL